MLPDAVHAKSYGTTLGAAVFALLCSIYLFTYSGVVNISDEVYIMATAESLAKRGDYTANSMFWKQQLGQVNLDTLEVIPATEPLQSVVSALLVWLALHVPHFGAIHTATLLNIFVTALTAVVVMALVTRLGYSPQVGACCALAFGLCTIAFPYSKLFFREPLAGLLVALAALCLTGPSAKRRVLPIGLAGLCLVAAYFTKEASIVVWPAFAWLAFERLKPPQGVRWHMSRRQALAVIAVTGVVLLAGWIVVALLFETRGFGGRTLGALAALPTRLTAYSRVAEAFAGMLISPGRGFFLYSPVAIAALLGYRTFYRAHRRDALFLASVCLLWLAAYVVLKNDIWWAGLAWGPRFLVPLAALIVIPLAPAFDSLIKSRSLRAHAGFVGLLVFSLWIEVVGSGVDIRLYSDALLKRIATGVRFDPSWAYWDPAYSPPFWMVPSLLRADNWNFAWARRVWGHADFQLAMFDWRIIGVCILFIVMSSIVLVMAFRGRGGRFARAGAVAWILAVGASACVAAFVAYATYDDPRFFGGDDRRRLLEALHAQEQPDDVMVLADNALARFVLNYSHATVDWYALNFEDETLNADNKTLIDHLLTVAPRIWLMLPYSSNRRQPRPLEQYLTSTSYPMRTQVFSDYAQLILFSVGPPPSAGAPSRNTNWRLGDRIDLTGYDLNSKPRADSITAGATVDLSLAWRAAAPLNRNYTVFVQLLSPDGKVVWQSDRYPANGLRPTSTWTAGELVRDNYAFVVAPEWGTGTFRVIAGMYEWPSMQRLTVSRNGVLAGDYIELTPLPVN